MDDFCINAIGEISVGERGDTLIGPEQLDKEQQGILHKWEELERYAGNHSSVRAYAGVLGGKPYRTLCVEFAGRFGGSIDVMGDGQSGEEHDYPHWAVDIECLDLDGSELTTLFCQVWLHRFFHQVG